jgi:NADH dehydrogenase
VARCIREELAGKPRGRFAYRDKGTMATIGRSRAIAWRGKLKLSGALAWMAWLLVHILFLIDFRNRLVVMFEWMWQYLTFKRGARLITGHLRPGSLEQEPTPAEERPPRVGNG